MIIQILKAEKQKESITIIEEPHISNNNQDYYYVYATHLCLISIYEYINLSLFLVCCSNQNNYSAEDFDNNSIMIVREKINTYVYFELKSTGCYSCIKYINQKVKT